MPARSSISSAGTSTRRARRPRSAASPTRSTPSASHCARRSATARRISRSPTTTPRTATNGCTAAARTTGSTDSGDWREHIVLTQHRYMLEDVRIGLSFLLSVGGAGRRRHAARARVPDASARRSAARTSCGPAAPWRAWGSASSTGRPAAACCAEALRERARAYRLPRRRPHGARHRGRVRLCGPRRRGGRLQGARRAAISQRLAAEAQARGAQRRWTSLARFGLFDVEAASTRSSARVLVVPEAEARRVLPAAAVDLRGRAGGARPQARGAGARFGARRAATRSSPRPPRPSWSTISRRRRASGALPQRPLAQSGLSRAAGRAVARRAPPIPP